jgi:hypothetical protein
VGERWWCSRLTPCGDAATARQLTTRIARVYDGVEAADEGDVHDVLKPAHVSGLEASQGKTNTNVALIIRGRCAAPCAGRSRVRYHHHQQWHLPLNRLCDRRGPDSGLTIHTASPSFVRIEIARLLGGLRTGTREGAHLGGGFGAKHQVGRWSRHAR